MEEKFITNCIGYIKLSAWLIIISGTLFLMYKRSRKKLVTLKEIENWAVKNRDDGIYLILHKISELPEEIKKEVYQEIGIKKVLYGYKDEASIHATIIDENDNIIKRMVFFGNKIDQELTEGFGENLGINIKLV